MTADIVILGANGQLGRALSNIYGTRALAFDRQTVDLSKPGYLSDLKRAIGNAPIKAVINAAAYTAVDKAESEEALAMRVNAEAVGELAAWCAKRDIALVHYSTDYVFDGKSDAPYVEGAATHPLNVYGRTKLAGEEALQKAGGRYLIFRTSWVYDAQGKNFFNTMLRLFSEKEGLRVVADQLGAPTYAPHLAKASADALDAAFSSKEFSSGIYHLCHNGHTSWHGFAKAILKLATARGLKVRCRHIEPIPTADYPTPAARPLNSRLDCTKARETLGIALPRWEDGLDECFETKDAN